MDAAEKTALTRRFAAALDKAYADGRESGMKVGRHILDWVKTNVVDIAVAVGTKAVEESFNNEEYYRHCSKGKFGDGGSVTVHPAALVAMEDHAQNELVDAVEKIEAAPAGSDATSGGNAGAL